MKKYAIVVAAGSGSRMNNEIPKQFLLLKEKPLYTFAVQAFLDAFEDIRVLLVIPSAPPYDKHELLKYFEKKEQIEIVTGGASRTESVTNALSLTEEESIVFIHDAVRPFINTSFLKMLYDETVQHGNAIPCIELTDSIRVINENENHAVPRQNYKAVQTPQVFVTGKLKQAYKQATEKEFTDDATVLENSGEKINLVQGLRENIKITYPADVIAADYLLNLMH